MHNQGRQEPETNNSTFVNTSGLKVKTATEAGFVGPAKDWFDGKNAE